MSHTTAVNSAPQTFTTFPLAKQTGTHYSPLPDAVEEGVVHAHALQTILVEAQALYELWSNVSSIPLWQEHVVSVTPISKTVSHWVMGNPEDADGKRIEFDSEITEDIPGQKLAWKSIGGDVEQHGEVSFLTRPDGRGTQVTLLQSTRVPGGALGNAVAAFTERSPRQTVIENLRHFKEFSEAGEIPSVKGQPHGPRGISGGIKEWMYGESNPTPPGSSEQA